MVSHSELRLQNLKAMRSPGYTRALKILEALALRVDNAKTLKELNSIADEKREYLELLRKEHPKDYEGVRVTGDNVERAIGTKRDLLRLLEVPRENLN